MEFVHQADIDIETYTLNIIEYNMCIFQRCIWRQTRARHAAPPHTNPDRAVESRFIGTVDPINHRIHGTGIFTYI